MIGSSDHPAVAPFWLPWLAGVPMVACMTVMALPEVGHGHAVAFRVLYAAAYLVWTLPLTFASAGFADAPRGRSRYWRCWR